MASVYIAEGWVEAESTPARVYISSAYAAVAQPPPEPATVQIAEAWVHAGYSPQPGSTGQLWVRINNQWVPCRLWVRINNQWV